MRYLIFLLAIFSANAEDFKSTPIEGIAKFDVGPCPKAAIVIINGAKYETEIKNRQLGSVQIKGQVFQKVSICNLYPYVRISVLPAPSPLTGVKESIAQKDLLGKEVTVAIPATANDYQQAFQEAELLRDDFAQVGIEVRVSPTEMQKIMLQVSRNLPLFTRVMSKKIVISTAYTALTAYTVQKGGVSTNFKTLREVKDALK
jgi:hypothetical protein